MNNIWDFLAQIINSINAFLTWYLNDTPLFEDTLDSLYNIGVNTTNELIPLIGEYIQYITEYIHV